jgi:hypothetical protein
MDIAQKSCIGEDRRGDSCVQTHGEQQSPRRRIAQVKKLKKRRDWGLNNYPQIGTERLGKGKKFVEAIDRVDIVFIIAVEGITSKVAFLPKYEMKPDWQSASFTPDCRFGFSPGRWTPSRRE